MGAEIAWGVLRRLPGAPGNALYPKLLPLCAAAVYIGRNPQRHPLYDGSADVLQLTNDFVSSVHCEIENTITTGAVVLRNGGPRRDGGRKKPRNGVRVNGAHSCLLYTSPSPRDVEESRMPSSA